MLKSWKRQSHDARSACVDALVRTLPDVSASLLRAALSRYATQSWNNGTRRTEEDEVSPAFNAVATWLTRALSSSMQEGCEEDEGGDEQGGDEQALQLQSRTFCT